MCILLVFPNGPELVRWPLCDDSEGEDRAPADRGGGAKTEPSPLPQRGPP